MRRRKQRDEPGEKLDATPALLELLSAQGDIDVTAFAVMIEAAQGAREDVRAIMGSLEAVNAAKRQRRELLAKISRDVVAAVVADAEGRALEFSPHGLGETSGYERVELAIPDPESPGRVRYAMVSLVDAAGMSLHHVKAAKVTVQGQLDSLSELGEIESLRLQMAMDRMSKMMSTLSNILKQASETSQSITQNLK